MRIHCPDGSVRESVILDLVEDSMRMAVQGYDDVLEFQLVNGIWLSDRCELVFCDFPAGMQQAQEFRCVIQQAAPAMRGLWN